MSYYTDWMDVIGANADDSNYIKSLEALKAEAVQDGALTKRRKE